MNSSVSDKRCEVNEIAVKNCATSRNFDDVEIKDVLENIRVLLNYIKKQKKKKGASLVSDPPAKGLVRAREGVVSTLRAIGFPLSPRQKICFSFFKKSSG